MLLYFEHYLLCHAFTCHTCARIAHVASCMTVDYFYTLWVFILPRVESLIITEQFYVTHKQLYYCLPSYVICNHSFRAEYSIIKRFLWELPQPQTNQVIILRGKHTSCFWKTRNKKTTSYFSTTLKHLHLIKVCIYLIMHTGKNVAIHGYGKLNKIEPYVFTVCFLVLWQTDTLPDVMLFLTQCMLGESCNPEQDKQVKKTDG